MPASQAPLYTHSENDSNIAGYESAWLDPLQGRESDLSVLWQMLERHNEQMEE